MPLPRFLVEPIAAQIAGRAGDEPVFTSPDGEVLRNNIDRAAESIGLAGSTPHELRHTWGFRGGAGGTRTRDRGIMSPLL